ncbi:hypothetical protein GCM10009641_06700 [Mycobacterium cookii]|uniref:Uncharacterized protein n=1 Tax=Mycobacterium cookii TaxID=1775 RepID=A0A7I7L1R8_9MYCO|nr:hypothetical protein MCOO_43000 [Mycobacterium cookii]
MVLPKFQWQASAALTPAQTPDRHVPSIGSSEMEQPPRVGGGCVSKSQIGIDSRMPSAYAVPVARVAGLAVEEVVVVAAARNARSPRVAWRSIVNRLAIA